MTLKHHIIEFIAITGSNASQAASDPHQEDGVVKPASLCWSELSYKWSLATQLPSGGLDHDHVLQLCNIMNISPS